MTNPNLLPNNATPLERALADTAARVGEVPAPIKELWDPWACPLDLLPWLAWALSADRWEVHWSEDQKRRAVADAIDLQRKKGTPAAVENVLKSFDDLLTLAEWWEFNGEPHTFQIDLPLISKNGDLGGFRSSAEFAEAIVRDVTRTKPARSHFILRQTLEGESSITVLGAGRSAGYRRGDFAADVDSATDDWSTVLLTEDGEPLELEPAAPGAFLEHEVMP